MDKGTRKQPISKNENEVWWTIVPKEFQKNDIKGGRWQEIEGVKCLYLHNYGLKATEREIVK